MKFRSNLFPGFKFNSFLTNRKASLRRENQLSIFKTRSSILHLVYMKNE